MDWYLLAAAVATGTSLHGMMESENVLQKLARLGKAIKTGKVDAPMVKGIDTRPKAYGLGIATVAFIVGLAYLILDWINPGVEGAMQYTIAILVLGELMLMIRLDVYHIKIEKMTRSQKK